MSEAIADVQDGISVVGHMISAARYADDKALVSDNQ